MKKHDIVCQTCGKKADWNLSNVWEKYPIDENGDYGEQEDWWSGDGSIDLCDKCYQNGDY